MPITGRDSPQQAELLKGTSKSSVAKYPATRTVPSYVNLLDEGGGPKCKESSARSAKFTLDHPTNDRPGATHV